MKILITGSAGFIGYHTAKKFINSKTYKVFGIDSLNSYYDKNLKINRISSLYKLNKNKNFFFKQLNLCKYKDLEKFFKRNKIDIVVNLAAQAGVRYSLINPKSYFKNNLEGFFNLLELSNKYKIKHLISASTSSVYGASNSLPFKTTSAADHPIQFYAATKRSNEIMAHSYSAIHKLPITILRFFTVYGPWGRPDMSLFLFVKNILIGKYINVFNQGKHSRDFTYVDDIVDGIFKVVKKIPRKKNRWSYKNPDLSSSDCPFKILNLGNQKKVSLMKFINAIEKNLGIKAKIKFLNLQKGDVKETLADISDTKKYINYKPKTSLNVGVKKFINWYRGYYKK